MIRLKKPYFIWSISIEENAVLENYISGFIESVANRKYAPISLSHTLNIKGNWSVEVLFERKDTDEDYEYLVSSFYAEKSSKLEDKANEFILKKAKEDYIPISISHSNTGKKPNYYSSVILLKKSK